MPAVSRGRKHGSIERAGQASDKPRGRKPRDTLERWDSLRGYGDLTVLLRQDC